MREEFCDTCGKVTTFTPNATLHNIIHCDNACGEWYLLHSEGDTVRLDLECDCGTTKAIKDAPLRAHSHWCSYRKGQEGL